MSAARLSHTSRISSRAIGAEIGVEKSAAYCGRLLAGDELGDWLHVVVEGGRRAKPTTSWGDAERISRQIGVRRHNGVSEWNSAENCEKAFQKTWVPVRLNPAASSMVSRIYERVR